MNPRVSSTTISVFLPTLLLTLSQVTVASFLRRSQPLASGPEADDIHVVYQAFCGAWSLHQSIALDWSWKHVEQPGKLTRIVTGCGPEDKKKMEASSLEGDPRFAGFHSEDWNSWVPEHFPEVKNDNYHAYTHPFGFADWLERAQPTESFILYMEPDMIFLEPILNHVPGAAPMVKLGQPVGQSYGYVRAHEEMQVGWDSLATKEICGEDCPDRVASAVANEKAFDVGPPTIMHKLDWARVTKLWGNYYVQARAHIRAKTESWEKIGDPPYIAEMLGYSLASAMAGLPHQVVNFNIDAVGACTTSDCSGYANRSMKLVHLCYPLGRKPREWIFNKYRPPFGYRAKGAGQWNQPLFMNCDMPLFAEPASTGQRGSVDWLILESTRTYNAAFLAFKEMRCPSDQLNKQKLIRVGDDGWWLEGNATGSAKS
jgi:hypothetical protein